MAQHTIQALQSELDSLRADNIKLFEKIKFLQNYSGRVSALLSFNPRYSRQGERQCGHSEAEGAGAVACWAALGYLAPSACQLSSLSWGEPPTGP